ncbi:metacaspase 5, putative [Trypanosoma brucei gambiense DAL972]|uniref:Metacaspase 5, putative n=1 Tax=Trypanosoma brucei gambiense (strain MHOM/CI/86/DAL972) TaxID=679716 RepID=C9ZZG8_TRYB9|nr:metacaspase 5, putative [Trypanosoma brucei gambiense DAL972]CBH14817.1 metacaspase 5, putative [Trypanosoma brucei gambiense DAL972]|eukprot:XP_011777083.1 metacaspase 5, putative [Trypanosoma brucei gambiense DAL972]
MDAALALLFGQVATAVLPYVVNSIGRVPRPKRVDVKKAMGEAHQCRPVVPYRAPRPYTEGRVKALFIGINYTGSSAQLGGCVNDVMHMLQTLQRIEFPISECCILVDDRRFPNFTAMPTRENIIKYMAWLVYDVRPGDVLFFHFSGHGAETKGGRDSNEKMDQCLVPLDYDKAGAILDDDLFELMIKGLPAGVRMTAVFDCCHSASLLDLPFAFVAGRNVSSNQRHEMRMVRKDNYSRGDVVMFSGCEDSGTSADVTNTSSFGNGTVAAGGAATQAFTWALLNTTGYSYIDIFMKTREVLRQKGYKQVPQLSSSKPVDLYKQFSLFGPLTMNASLVQHLPQEYVQPWAPHPAYQQPHEATLPASVSQPHSQPVMGIPVASTSNGKSNPGVSDGGRASGEVYPPTQYPSSHPAPQQQAYYQPPQQAYYQPPQQAYYQPPQQAYYQPPQQAYYQPEPHHQPAPPPPPKKENKPARPGYPMSYCMKFSQGKPGRK